MRRGETGRYAVTAAGGETVRAFIPSPLPPVPALALDGPLQRSLETATLALGRLDGVSTLLPDKEVFLYSFVRKEALLSSQIEGTQSTLSDTSCCSSSTSRPACRSTTWWRSPATSPRWSTDSGGCAAVSRCRTV